MDATPPLESEPRMTSLCTPPLAGLLTALSRLDALIATAVPRVEAAYGPGAARDGFRGLHVSPTEIERLLSRRPAGSAFWTDDQERVEVLVRREGCDDGFDRLRRLFGLDDFDLDILVLALAPELDARYERLYGYLQDDVTRRRPTVDLALSLLSGGAESRLLLRQRFAPDAPLLRHGLVSLTPDPHQVEPTLLAHYIRLDGHLEHRLLGLPGLAPNLAGWCEWVSPEHSSAADGTESAAVVRLTALVQHATTAALPFCAYLMGMPGVGKRLVAERTARAYGMPLLAANLAKVTGQNGPAMLGDALRAATIDEAVLYLSSLDALRIPGQERDFRALLEQLALHRGPVLLAGTQPWPAPREGPAGVVPIAVEKPDMEARRDLWRRELSARGMELPDVALAELSSRFQLNRRQIADATAWGALANGDVSASGALHDTLSRAARAQSGLALAELASKIEARETWNDLVLPADALAQLHELCDRVDQRHRVFDQWGFGRKLSRGRGTTALFSGGSGTGKTMAAEVIANALGLDLYRIDLARIVSKYIGETEKNLDRVFSAAADSNAILFFDEADALFGKRSEVKDAHDRYANIEISYLLQEMEEYEGVAILATNLVDNLDDAFTRRLGFHVYFPFPDEAARHNIWVRAWPEEVPLTPSVDRRVLARELRLAGGSIRNIALSAAFAAASNGGAIESTHVTHAVRREYQKAGRSSALVAGFKDRTPQSPPPTGAP